MAKTTALEAKIATLRATGSQETVANVYQVPILKKCVAIN